MGLREFFFGAPKIVTAAPNPGAFTESHSSAFRADGWVNVDTGIGTSQDKRMSTVPTANMPLPHEWLVALYNNSAIAARVVDEITACALEKEFSVSESNGAPIDRVKETLDIAQVLSELATWGRLFGGALAIFSGPSSGAMSEPLRAYSSIRWAKVVDRRYITIGRRYRDPNSPKFGEPETYLVGTGEGESYRYTEIHETRCIRWDGAKVDRQAKASNSGWHYSVLQRSYEDIRDFDAAYSALTSLVADAAQGVFKVQGLIDAIASGAPGAERIQARMRLVDRTRSTLRSVLVDAEREDFTRVATPFAGIPESVDRIGQRLSASTGIPLSRLLNRLGAALGSDSDQESQFWASKVIDFQRKELAPKIKRYYTMQGKEVEVHFPSYLEMGAKERAEIEQFESVSDRAYFDMGVVTLADIARRRLTTERGWLGVDIEQRVRELEEAEASVDVDLTELDVEPTEPAATADEDASA